MKNCGKSYSVLFLIPRRKKDLELSFEFSFLAGELDTHIPGHGTEDILGENTKFKCRNIYIYFEENRQCHHTYNRLCLFQLYCLNV